MDRNRKLYVNTSFGQESTAIVELLRQRRRWMPRAWWDLEPVLVFSDTGAEMPYTYEWAYKTFLPYLRSIGLKLHWLRPGGPYHRTAPTKRYPQGRIIRDIRTMYLSDKHPSFPMIASGARCTETHKQNVLARFRAATGLATHGRTPHEQVRLGHRDCPPEMV